MIVKPDATNSLIINPFTGRTPNPRETMGMSRSGLVDPTSHTRPTVKIKDEKAPFGFRIVNLENYDPATMEKVSDIRNPSDAPVEIEEEEEVIDKEDEVDVDLQGMTKSELIAFAKLNKLDINTKGTRESIISQIVDLIGV